MNADDFVGGHSILALERFMDETRHMIIFDVLSWKSPVGEKGERLRLFLSDVGYLWLSGAKSQGMKQLMAGGGVALIGITLVPLLSGLFG